jgi:hypothetical protein
MFQTKLRFVFDGLYFKLSTFRAVKMVRNYKKKTERGNYDSVTIAAAINDVKSGMCIREAARTHGISHSTLIRYIHRDNTNVQKPGSKAIFTAVEEKHFADHIVECANTFHGLSVQKTRELAYKYAVELGKVIPKSWELNKSAGSHSVYYLGSL